MGNTTQPVLKKHSTSGEHKDFVYAASAMQGWRTTMEDESVVEPDLGDGNSLFAVFDGHGGKFKNCQIQFPSLGNQISQFLKQHFKQMLLHNENYKKKCYKEALEETFLQIDYVLQMPNAKMELEKDSPLKSNEIGSYGSTGCVLLMCPTELYVANIGDSRIVATTGKYQFKALSEDHKPCNEQEYRRIINAGGYVKNERVNGCLAISRAFGDFKFKQNGWLSEKEQIVTAFPEVVEHKKSRKEQPFAKKDLDFLNFLLLGSDGIWENATNEIIMSCVYKRLSEQSRVSCKSAQKVVEEIMDELVAESEEYDNGLDNMTAILIVFK